MSEVLKYITATGHAAEYLHSVNTPDYESPVPPHSFLINPDVSGLYPSIPVKYWKVSGSTVLEMTTEEKQAVDDAEDQARSPCMTPVYLYDHLNVVQCENADWAVNHAAPLIDDPTYNAIKVIRLDNGLVSGIGFEFFYPSDKTCLVLTVWGRSSDVPAADRLLTLKLYMRILKLNGTLNSWTSKTLDDATIPQDAYYHTHKWIKNVSSYNLGGKIIQMQLVRHGDTDTLEHPFYLKQFMLEFS